MILNVSRTLYYRLRCSYSRYQLWLFLFSLLPSVIFIYLLSCPFNLFKGLTCLKLVTKFFDLHRNLGFSHEGLMSLKSDMIEVVFKLFLANLAIIWVWPLRRNVLFSNLTCQIRNIPHTSLYLFFELKFLKLQIFAVVLLSWVNLLRYQQEGWMLECKSTYYYWMKEL